MRLLIRSMAMAVIFVVAIQPSAKAEVASSSSYWQQLDEALRTKQQQDLQALQHFYDVVTWNNVVAWNEALAVAQKTTPPKTTQPKPKVTSDTGPQSGDKFDRVAQCESGGKAGTNTGNGYYGAFQFTLSTWRAVGGTGLPSDHSYAEQKEKAIALAGRANPGSQWPVCWYR